MALNPAVIAGIIEVGTKLYEFIDKVANKGEKGDLLQPIVTQLHAIRQDINRLGEQIRQALDNAVDEIVGDIRLTQLAQLPDAHAAVVDYLRSHPTLPNPPQRNDPNYVVARGKTSDVLTYFLNHAELAFMGGFIYATNTRIEFITGLDSCWFQNDPKYINEIRSCINHLNSYIAYIKRRIDAGFRVKVTTKFQVLDNTTRPPLREAVSHTLTVTTDDGQVVWTKTVPAELAQLTAARNTANGVRRQHSLARQTQVMGSYDRIATTWNSLVVNFASASIQQALSPRAETTPLRIAPGSLEITSLREIEPAGERDGTGEGPEGAEPSPARYALPLRDVLVKVLHSAEFRQRHELALSRSDQLTVAFWFRKAFHREPTADEASTLSNVMKLFGYKALISALAYSNEYDQRWGEGLPTVSAPTDGFVEPPAMQATGA